MTEVLCEIHAIAAEMQLNAFASRMLDPGRLHVYTLTKTALSPEPCRWRQHTGHFCMEPPFEWVQTEETVVSDHA